MNEFVLPEHCVSYNINLLKMADVSVRKLYEEHVQNLCCSLFDFLYLL